MSRLFSWAIPGPEVEEEDPDWWDQISDYVTLSRTQRFYGFAICFSLGTLCSLLSSFFVASIATDPSSFAITYTLGNVLSLCSTAFLVGPCKQVKTMFSPVRASAAGIYIASIALTIVAATVMESGPLTLIALIIQFAALFWYSMSYIPYGRSMISSCCGAVVGV